MNLTYLQYFVSLSRTLHYTKTAEELFITQSGLSYAIDELEKKLGFELFARKGRGVSLTKSGQVYYAHISVLLERLDAAAREAMRAGRSDTNRCVLATTSTSYATRLMRKFEKRCNNDCDIKIIRSESRKVYSSLLSGRADIGITPHHTSDLRYDNLKVRGPDLVLIVPNDHPLSQEKVVSLKEASRHYPFVKRDESNENTAIIYKRIRDAGIIFSISGECNSTHSVAWMVANGVGISVVSMLPELVHFPIKYLQFSDFDSKIYYYVNRIKNFEHDALCDLFWDMIRSEFAIE